VLAKADGNLVTLLVHAHQCSAVVVAGTGSPSRLARDDDKKEKASEDDSRREVLVMMKDVGCYSRSIEPQASHHLSFSLH
jgi:hypothetical protein